MYIQNPYLYGCTFPAIIQLLQTTPYLNNLTLTFYIGYDLSSGYPNFDLVDWSPFFSLFSRSPGTLDSNSIWNLQLDMSSQQPIQTLFRNYIVLKSSQIWWQREYLISVLRKNGTSSVTNKSWFRFTIQFNLLSLLSVLPLIKIMKIMGISLYYPKELFHTDQCWTWFKIEVTLVQQTWSLALPRASKNETVNSNNTSGSGKQKQEEISKRYTPLNNPANMKGEFWGVGQSKTSSFFCTASLRTEAGSAMACLFCVKPLGGKIFQSLDRITWVMRTALGMCDT